MGTNEGKEIVMWISAKYWCIQDRQSGEVLRAVDLGHFHLILELVVWKVQGRKYRSSSLRP